MAEKTAEELAAELAAKEKAEKDAQDKKFKFTPEQTEFINKLYGNAFAEGAKKVEETAEKAKQALAAQLEEEKKQREALATQIAELQKKTTEPPKEPAKSPELDLFKAQLEEMKGVLNGIKSERDELKKRVDSADEMARKARKKDLFLGALKDAGVDFFDPLEAYDLAEKSGYEWDKEADRPVILNKETQRPKLNENGEPMNVIDFVKDFATKKKYLVKAPDQSGGTGSGPERRMERQDEKPEKSFADMTDEEFQAYTQKVMAKQR